MNRRFRGQGAIWAPRASGQADQAELVGASDLACPGTRRYKRRADGSPLLSIWLRGLAAAALVGFAGRRGGPRHPAQALASGLSFFDLGRRDRIERSADVDAARSAFEPDLYGPAMQLAFLGVLCAGAWDNRAPEVGWHPPGLLTACGLAVILAGVALRRSAARALGRHFTVGLTLLADHELIATGPYQWLRHPNYAGLLLIALGTAMMLQSPHAVGVTLVVWLPLALLRIDKEERVLRERLGDAYTEYSRERWCLLPGVY
jgi:protein-S-isoprenylcysteine O-methyltransferase Ste14